MTELSTAPDEGATRPSIPELLAAFGEEELSIQALFRFCYLPAGRLSFLKDLAVAEEWGARDFALLKYLAVHLHLAIAQGNFVWNGDQLVSTAGALTTKTGAPIYVGISPNAQPEGNPFVVNWVGERPSTQTLPAPPDLGVWPELDPGGEVVVACEFEHPERRLHLGKLDDVPVVARMSAIAGAVSWSLRRGLAARQMHSGGRGWFVPVYLSSRADLLATPDFVAPLLAQELGGRAVFVVRSLISAQGAYAPARALVERCELLPGWLLGSWEEAAEDSAEAEE
jgi:hypothetical protein